MARSLTLAEVEAVLGVAEAAGLPPSQVMLPLRTADPGGVRRVADGRYEIVVPSGRAFEEWIADLRGALVGLFGGRD